MDYKKVILKPKEDIRIRRGDVWIYDNEIASDISNYEKGEIVKIYNSDVSFIGIGYINPLSKITIRLLTRDENEVINKDFLENRIRVSDEMRNTVNPMNNFYRMVYAESDFLPGLVIDRFDNHFIVQITTAGMERFKKNIFEILSNMYPNAIIIEKSVTTSRSKEGLDDINRMITKNSSSKTVIEVNGVKFYVDFLKSQKTGFFLDQRENYLLLKNISKNREVLDVFSYLGAWGLHAYKFGAKSVGFIEISQEFLNQTKENVRLNEFKESDFKYTRADAIKLLKELSKSGLKKDLIILDPPAFVKSRNRVKQAMRGYKEINLRAFRMLKPNSYLITCSCSHFLSKDDFIKVIHSASLDAKRRIKLISFNSQPYDHSILLPMFQSEYLKCGLFFVY